ncbi:hypothetical protein [Bdellovibrio sp. HCB274]|uniref:hypothetical protein n=1 Tax=Bdellovibrio sp. HCB274 TaxID=3394361 RepID=UPI0039B3FE21
MKRGILFAVLIFFHIAWIGTLTMADAASESTVHLPQEVLVSAVLLIVWVAYQALSWAHSGILEKNK